MRVNRKLIYAGVFLVALGGVLVAADQGGVATATLKDALRFWPLGLIALGLALVLRRTAVGFPAGVLAAVAPGLLLGGVLAIAPRYGYDCGATKTPSPEQVQSGSFAGQASVSVRSGCGSLSITTQAGSAWQLATGNSDGINPDVSATSTSLEVATVGGDDRIFRGGRDFWQLALPATGVTELDLDLSATHTDVSLPGTAMDGLSVRADLSDVVIDASLATVTNLDVRTNLSSVSIRLSDLADLVGSIRADAAGVQLCVPPDLGLRITSRTSAGSLSVGGLEQTGSTWESPNYDTAAHRADIDVRISLASVEINPIGGCK